MAGSDRWYFTKEVLANTPSRKCGIDSDKELSYRQQAANLIQDMGQRLHVSQLCINTAIVYMHRFYTFHSLTKFQFHSIASCALFLAAKVEEQPRKLEHVIKVSHMCLHRDSTALDTKSDTYQEQAMELVFNENLMLQTLGFDVAVEHPHSSVVNCCQLVRASKDLAQTSYFMATNSLHLTTMCLQYKPTVVACFCIHMACKWSSWEIPRSSEGKDWFYYVDKSVTLELLEQLTSEFLAILDKCPSRLKRKILSIGGGRANNGNTSLSLTKPIDDKKSYMNKDIKEELKQSIPSKSIELTVSGNSSQTRRSPPSSPSMKKVKSEPQQSNKIPVAMSYTAYREKKDKERASLQQTDVSKQVSEQSKPSNKCSINTITAGSQPFRDKPMAGEKLSAKQQQMIIDRQKQSDERHKQKPKIDHLFEANRTFTPSKPVPTPSAPKTSQNNSTPEDFYDCLINKSSNHINFNTIFSTDNDDSSEFKKEIATDLKMEFSDNDSNLSTNGLNLTSLPSAFMNDSSDSKTGLLNNNSNSQSSSFDAKPTSFMSIFSTPIANTSNTNSTPVVKPENVKKNIPSKYIDPMSVISRIKPERLPPMLSPLKNDSELCPKHDSQSSMQSHLSVFETSAQQYLKPIHNPNVDLDLKKTQKAVKSLPKTRPIVNQQKNSISLSHNMNSFKDEVPDISHNIKLEKLDIITQLETDRTVDNMNLLNNTIESIPNISVKQEFKDKSIKTAEIPSVSVTKPLKNSEFNNKPVIESVSAFSAAPVIQQNLNSSSDPLDNSLTKPATHGKDVKDKHSQEHQDKHHKHNKHKHKDKHKHKHKDKDREKKRKDKDRDKDKHNELKDGTDPSYKLSWTSPKNETDVSLNINPSVQPIKLKISKKKVSVDEPEKDNEIPQNPLKLRIQLKDQKLTANSSSATIYANDSSNSSSTRKRKSSPKSSRKEKVSKHDSESNVGTYNNSKLDETLKISSKSKKSIESTKKGDDKRSSVSHHSSHSKSLNSSTVNYGQQMHNMGTTQTQHSRSSKTHK